MNSGILTEKKACVQLWISQLETFLQSRGQLSLSSADLDDIHRRLGRKHVSRDFIYSILGRVHEGMQTWIVTSEEKATEILGLASVECVAPRVRVLHLLCLDERIEKKGCGRQLFTLVASLIRSTYLVIHSTSCAHGFYLKCGCVPGVDGQVKILLEEERQRYYHLVEEAMASDNLAGALKLRYAASRLQNILDWAKPTNLELRLFTYRIV